MEQEVERILGVRLVYQKLKYRVKQKGFDNDLNKYFIADLQNTPLALKEFHYNYPDEPGPPRNLQYWLDCAEKEIDVEDCVGDNLP